MNRRASIALAMGAALAKMVVPGHGAFDPDTGLALRPGHPVRSPAKSNTLSQAKRRKRARW